MLHPRSLSIVLWATLLFALPWPIYSRGITLQPLLFTMTETGTAFSIAAVLSQAVLAAITQLILAIFVVKQLCKFSSPLPISFVGLIIFSLLFIARTFPIYDLNHSEDYDLQQIYQYSPEQQMFRPTTPESF
jgi:polyferredoxin